MNWNDVVRESVEIRHWFHRHPELTWEEKNTASRIRQQLTAWQIPWRGCAEFGTVATLAAQAPGEHIAFRADMDALPITENAAVEFCSTDPGKMHACGHDGHMAALLGAAAWFKQQEAQLQGPVTLIFQPAEEGGHGAKKMIEEGALDGVDSIFGWHNWPALPAGTALCPDGAVMSGNGTFHMTIKGRGGHASQPEAARDPVLAAAAITLNLQQIISRRLPAQAAAVVSVTTIVADSNVTVIPESVRLEGSIRLSDPRWRQPINALIDEIATNTAAAYGVTADVEVRSRYEATINDHEAAARYRQAIQAELGEHCHESDLLLPIMASEDFSYYLNKVPGAFALVGMAEDEPDGAVYQAPCHSPEYRFNDRIIESVIRVFCRLAGVTAPAGDK
ncbi:N(2)-acetyl-L-2,4-diaminobutanoate deacetylase DoeB2 [Sulfuriflexus sp.]|uniref:N(2)-acetyl-L-2,4-diaminobutanoate deacetylase DoeB2 n=1 Tax=Sulfuriflexus sp. TaxID=2015443 RepID=UPI0028CC8E1F|nr:N(2)-acetyl-L-2,4-diaminobutanoate deacetylase DoeB2 [Sulfuriflexus sp.]MDT8404132.1 N(2)-acetyl-L-2,4-diaminobutanoate deacetylase DoeB2 [Sulfuriflexus sp.]